MLYYARYGWTTQRNLLWILSELFVISCANASIVGRWILLGLGVHGASLSLAFLHFSSLAWSLATTIMSGGMLGVDCASSRSHTSLMLPFHVLRSVIRCMPVLTVHHRNCASLGRDRPQVPKPAGGNCQGDVTHGRGEAAAGIIETKTCWTHTFAFNASKVVVIRRVVCMWHSCSCGLASPLTAARHEAKTCSSSEAISWPCSSGWPFCTTHATCALDCKYEGRSRAFLTIFPSRWCCSASRSTLTYVRERPVRRCKDEYPIYASYQLFALPLGFVLAILGNSTSKFAGGAVTITKKRTITSNLYCWVALLVHSSRIPSHA